MSREQCIASEQRHAAIEYMLQHSYQKWIAPELAGSLSQLLGVHSIHTLVQRNYHQSLIGSTSVLLVEKYLMADFTLERFGQLPISQGLSFKTREPRSASKPGSWLVYKWTLVRFVWTVKAKQTKLGTKGRRWGKVQSRRSFFLLVIYGSFTATTDEWLAVTV